MTHHRRLQRREECESGVLCIGPLVNDCSQVGHIELRERGGHMQSNRVDEHVEVRLHAHALVVELLDAHMAPGSVVLVLHVGLVD